MSLAALRGRFVLVNFFASWCGSCRTEEPELVRLDHEHYGATDVAILGVALNDTTSGARDFLRSSGAVWSAIQDSGGHVALAYAVQRPPVSFLVTPDGKVVAKFVGEVTASEVHHYVDAARAERM